MSWWIVGSQAAGVTSSLKAYLGEFLKAHPKADAFPLRIGMDPDSDLKQLEITFLGKSAHGSRPLDGHNAILDGLRFFAGVPELPQVLGQFAKFMLESCENIYGEGLGIAGEHDFLGRTTCSLNMLEIDSEGAQAIINVRPTLGTSSVKILETVRARIDAWASENKVIPKVDFNTTPHEPLYVDPEKHPELIGALQQAFERVTGHEAKLVAKAGTTFAKAFPNSVTFGPVYPAEEEDLAHQADECIRVDHLLRNVKIYGLALMLLAVDGTRISKSSGHGLGL